MVYNKYMNVSDSNCVSSPVCSAQPVDGCVCGEGYVLDNNKCVLPKDCGCWYNNSIYIQVYYLTLLCLVKLIYTNEGEQHYIPTVAS